MAIEVQHAVSIGSECRVAYNLRRHFNFGDAYPFDWWICTVDGVFEALANRGKIYDEDSLVPKLSHLGGIETIVHKSGQINFFHEFVRDRSKPGSFVTPTWATATSKPRERFNYLVSKLDTANKAGQTVLWVRYGKVDGGLDKLASRFHQELPGIRSYFLFVNAGLTGELPDNVFCREINDERQWKGSPEAWDALFNSLPFRVQNPDLKPYSELAGPETREERPF